MLKRKISVLLDWLVVVMWALAIIAALYFFPGCGEPKVYPQAVLSDQELYPHPDFPGLVNRSCTRYTKGLCTTWSAKVQDTRDARVRANLQRLQFVCDVGGKIYHPCTDQNALCRNTFTRKKILGLPIGKKVQHVDALSLEPGPDKDFLISARTVCHRFRRYGDSPW